MEARIKKTVYENALAKIVATKEDWGIEIIFFGNCELSDPIGIKKIIDWFDTVKNEFIYVDFRNTLSIDDGTIGLILVLKQIGFGWGGDFAVICSNNPANKIAIAFKNIALNSPIKVLHSHHTFIMNAKSQAAQAAEKAGGAPVSVAAARS